jgi:hypothetical protein
MDYSLGLMVRKARCLHQKLKLECSGRAIRRIGPLVMLWTAPPPPQNAMDAVAVFLLEIVQCMPFMARSRRAYLG